MTNDAQITDLLVAWSDGDGGALEQLTPLIYDHLRRIASIQMRRERPGHTLQATALANEAYLRLVDQHSARWTDRAHFMAVVAQLMRRILLDYARRRASAKRGGGWVWVTLAEEIMPAVGAATGMIELDDAIRRLEERNPRYGRVIELRYFAGLSVEETAAALEVSTATIKRDWRLVKAWLKRELAPGAGHET